MQGQEVVDEILAVAVTGSERVLNPHLVAADAVQQVLQPVDVVGAETRRYAILLGVDLDTDVVACDLAEAAIQIGPGLIAGIASRDQFAEATQVSHHLVPGDSAQLQRTVLTLCDNIFDRIR